ncbi:hypothetical protein ABSA61_006103, partial [Burkholderia multivorans]
MENVSGMTATSPIEKNSLTARLKGINRLFLVTVIAPTLAATVYFGVVASDVYVSEARFVVRSAQRQGQMSLMGSLLQGSGLARSQEDVYPVVDYIESRDALQELNRNHAVLDSYSKQGDFISRFNAGFDQ